MGGPGSFSRPYRPAFFFLIGLFLAINLSGIDRSCLDAADSAYLISADAIAGGMVPYRDFLAAHPPLLYLLGAPLAWIGSGVIPFRVFSLLVLAGLGLAVWRLAFRLSGRDDIAFLAGAFALFAPLGIFFSKLFIQDSLLALLAVAGMILLLGGSRRQVIACAVVCVAAVMLKLTFLPVLLLFGIYLYRYRRQRLSLFLKISIGGSLALVLGLELVTGGAFLDDILFAQASKGYSFTNFYEGLHRIWQMDWPLLVAAVPGLWFASRHLGGRRSRGARFLLLGWLAAGGLLLLTLFADGHDTNLFQLVEPAVALFAAWGIMGLAGEGRAWAVAASVLLLLGSVVVVVEKDRDFIGRSNAGDVAMIVQTLEDNSGSLEASLVPGCHALEADRPVAQEFFDQFLWEQKYQRGDADALQMFDGLDQAVSQQALPVVVFENDRPSLKILGPSLAANYSQSFDGSQWPPVIMWLPGKLAHR